MGFSIIHRGVLGHGLILAMVHDRQGEHLRIFNRAAHDLVVLHTAAVIGNGDHPGAIVHWREAHRLYPDNWTYKRQAWNFEDPVRQGHTDAYDGSWFEDVKKIQAKIDFEVVSRAPVPSTPNGNGNGNGHSDDFKALMKACVSEAVDITKEVNTIPWQNEDVRSIALTMFIQRARLN